jgi:hypothetical protein
MIYICVAIDFLLLLLLLLYRRYFIESNPTTTVLTNGRHIKTIALFCHTFTSRHGKAIIIENQ